jgi:HEAT repeats
MALKIRLTEDTGPDVVARLDAAFDLDADRASLERVRRAVAGDDPQLSTRAMALLFATDFPNKHREFESVLADEQAPELSRRAAAIYLGRLQTAEAVEVLVQHLDARDEGVLSAVVRSLGAAGGKNALDALTKLKRELPRSVADETDIACAFIAYRIGLEAHDLPIPSDFRFIDVDESCTGKLEIMSAGRNDAEFCLRSLGRRPFGIELSEYPAFQIRCQRRFWLFLPNRAFVSQPLVRIPSNKGILGIVASRNEATGLYALGYVLLATPADNGTVRIMASRTNGQLAFGGSARLDDGGLHFSLRAVARPGAFGVGIEGTLDNGELRIRRAVAALTPQNHRLRPVPEHPVAE